MRLNGADSQWVESYRTVEAKSGSRQTAWSGNGSGRRPVAEAVLGDRVTLQVLTRMQLEQFSDSNSWTPTGMLS
jgi:hypothetical protein